jgi:hypothetical protein
MDAAPLDPRLAALLDKQAIEEVVLRYCRGIDRRDFDLVRSCYHPDARDHHGSFEGGVDAYLEWVDRLTARYEWTMHFVANVLVELGDDSDVAACETYGVSLHRSDDPRPFMNLATGFRYLDRFERREGAWRIAERHAIGEWSIPVPEEAWWSIPESHASGRRDASDALYALLASIGRKALRA